MTTSTTNGQTIEATPKVETQTEIVRNPDAVLAKNKELLGVVASLKEEMGNMKSQVTNFEQDKLQAEGKKDELISALRKQLGDAEDARKTDRNSYAMNVITSGIKEEATKQGCINGDALIKLLDKDDYASLEVNDTFNANAEDVKRLLEVKREAYGFLFKKTVPRTVEATPGNLNSDFTKTVKDPKKMSVEEIQDALRKLE